MSACPSDEERTAGSSEESSGESPPPHTPSAAGDRKNEKTPAHEKPEGVEVVELQHFALEGAAAVGWKLPTLQPSRRGVLTVRLPHDLSVEVTLEGDVRVIGKEFQVLSMANGKQLGILHPYGRLFCDEQEVRALFSERPLLRRGRPRPDSRPAKRAEKAAGDCALPPPLSWWFGLEAPPEPPAPPRRRRGGRKQRGETGGLEFRALLRPTEILFGASNFAHAVHLEGSRRPRVLSAAVFPEVGLDCLSALIHARDVPPSDENAAACQRWIDDAQFERLLTHQQAAIQLSVGPVRVRQKAGGGVEVFAPGGRHLRFAPEQVEVSVRVRGVEASCRKHGVGHFKCGRRRFHTSRSGIVVSDAKTATSIDNFGVLHSH